MTEYHTKKRCKYMIKLHIILVTKYRKPLLIGELDEEIKENHEPLYVQSSFDKKLK